MRRYIRTTHGSLFDTQENVFLSSEDGRKISMFEIQPEADQVRSVFPARGIAIGLGFAFGVVCLLVAIWLGFGRMEAASLAESESFSAYRSSHTYQGALLRSGSN